MSNKNKNINVADILNTVIRKGLCLSDTRIPPTPHFWISDTGRFHCTATVWIRNSADLQVMDDLLETFPEPNEVRMSRTKMLIMVQLVYGKYPEPQGDVEFVIALD